MKKNISRSAGSSAIKKRKQISSGVACISATFNNTIVSISDAQGAVIAWSSAGSSFKGSKKSTPYAAQVTAEKAMKKAMEFGLKTVFVKVSGPGAGRDSAIRAIANLVIVTAIRDVTPVAHNGCRPRKQRRM